MEAEVASLNDCIDCLEHYRLVLCDITSNYIYMDILTQHIYICEEHCVQGHNPNYNYIDNDDNHCSSYGTNHVEDVVFKANAARDDAESWLCQIADGEL